MYNWLRELVYDELRLKYKKLGREDAVELAVIIFQVMYTLYCFEKIGVMHNDLHLTTFSWTTLPRVFDVNYRMGSDVVLVHTDIHAKVYDFDWAEKHGTAISGGGTIT